MAESVSNDRAIEVLADALIDAQNEGESNAPDVAERQVEALAGAGLQITDLTPEEANEVANVCEWAASMSRAPLGIGEAVPKLRRLSEANVV